MLESIKGLSSWCHKDCRMIYRLRRQKIMKQNESDGDPCAILEIITILEKGIKILNL